VCFVQFVWVFNRSSPTVTKKLSVLCVFVAPLQLMRTILTTSGSRDWTPPAPHNIHNAFMPIRSSQRVHRNHQHKQCRARLCCCAQQQHSSNNNTPLTAAETTAMLRTAGDSLWKREDATGPEVGSAGVQCRVNECRGPAVQHLKQAYTAPIQGISVTVQVLGSKACGCGWG
jgi:hypothetical protein